MKLWFYFRTHRFIEDLKVQDEQDDWYEYRILLGHLGFEEMMPFGVNSFLEALPIPADDILSSYFWLEK